jgi:hydroxymethylpyrimidine/phosphomethylpyrimidine kinase
LLRAVRLAHDRSELDDILPAVTNVPRVLTIAGSDSGGGAGIAADLRAFARCGVYGTCAVTAVTAQNTRGVVGVHEVPSTVVRAQIEAVAGDIGFDAVKIGMLASPSTVRVVAGCMSELGGATGAIVVDPVLVASSGARLLAEDALAILIAELLPLAAVVTPNLPEALALIEQAGLERGATDSDLARAVLELGPRSVVLTGGHRQTPGDIYCDPGQLVEIETPRHVSSATHGSGCTHSAVLAAELAKGRKPLEAAETAARFTAEAVLNGLEEIGAGPGPVDIFNMTAPGDARQIS